MKPLPKIELHLHLEGSMRPDTCAQLSIERLGSSGPLEPGWEHRYYTYTDFFGFMQQLTPRFPGRPDEYARIAFECFEDLAAQNVVYVEVSFDVPVREANDDSRFWPIMEALEEARRAAESRFPIRANYIAAIMRTLPVEVAIRRVELAIEARERGMGIVGIDLHGDEVASGPAPFIPAFELARQHGMGLRAHAGEAMGPESIRAAVELLGVRRVAHGIRAFDDEVLMAELKHGDVTLEVCPTSNVRTALVPDLQSHPIRLFFDMGIPITVNSDDPLPFFTNIEREYRLLVEEFGFTIEDLREITVTAAHASFTDETEKAQLVKLVNKAYLTTERAMGVS